MNLKISIGMNIQPGPFGGGNQFGKALRDHLQAQGAQVSFDLSQPGLDMILLTEPRKNLTICAYDDQAILGYLAKNRQTLVVHRVNECDERKGTDGVNRRLKRANLVADHTVFVSAWLRDLHLRSRWPSASHSVIRNGSDPVVFNPKGLRPWDGVEPLKLVTHHWSNNWNKGFDIYTRLDGLLGRDQYKGRFEFTYIGNLPDGLSFENSAHIAPISGPALADALREHHVYLTASRNEPGSHHQNEGAACGLPVLYLENASMSEYCQGFGIAFTLDNFEEKLEQMRGDYPALAGCMKDYPNTAQLMTQSYAKLFEYLLQNRDQVLAARLRRRTMHWWLDRLGLARPPHQNSRSLELG